MQVYKINERSMMRSWNHPVNRRKMKKTEKKYTAVYQQKESPFVKVNVPYDTPKKIPINIKVKIGNTVKTLDFIFLVKNPEYMPDENK